MKQETHNKRRRNGLLLAVLVGGAPMAGLAWWGPGPGPMWGHPGFSGPPGPPSVGQFMSNPWAYGTPSMPYGQSPYARGYRRPAAPQAKAVAPSAPAPATEPAAAAPAPAVAATESVVAAPEPVVAALEAVEAAPEPVVAAPVPAVAVFAPVVAAPAPAVAVPAPVVAAPEPAVVAPAPASAALAHMVHPEPAPAAEGTAVTVHETFQGKVLVDAEGMSLYIYTLDELGSSSCSGGCAESWPPAVPAPHVAAEGSFSVITRADGSEQWAYKGRPLYRWIHDGKPGDTTGDGVGGVWNLARAD